MILVFRNEATHRVFVIKRGGIRKGDPLFPVPTGTRGSKINGRFGKRTRDNLMLPSAKHGILTLEKTSGETLNIKHVKYILEQKTRITRHQKSGDQKNQQGGMNVYITIQKLNTIWGSHFALGMSE